MPKIESQPNRRVAFAGTDAQGSAKVWVPKPPTPRRSVFSEVRQALSRAVTHAPLDAALLADEVMRLEASIKDLRESNAALRQQLHIPPPKKNPRASEFFDLRLKIDGLKKEHKKLQASNFVLGEVASADAQLTRVLDALNGGRPHEIANEAIVFFRQLEDLDAHRRGDKPEHTTAALFGQRVQVRMKGVSVVQAAALQRSARVFLNQVDPSSMDERAVVESILLGVLAWPVPSETSKKALQTLDSRRLSAISVSTKAILEELGHLGLKLKPKDKVPGTGLTLEALQALLKNADALQNKRAIAPTTGQKLGALTAQTNPIRKAVTPSTSRPSVQVQTTTTRDKATADAAQQAFQRNLVEAMNFMWNEDVSEEGFAVLLDQSASGLFAKAMVQLQEAGLDDGTQRQWILDALGSVKPSLFPHLRARLDDGFQQRLAQEIDASRFEPKQELKDLAGLWWYCVMSATDANT